MRGQSKGTLRDLSGAVIAAYADADGFPTAKKVRSGGLLGHAASFGARLIAPMSYQSIVALAQSLSDHPSEWNALAAWVERKIKAVTAMSQVPAQFSTGTTFLPKLILPRTTICC